MPFPVLILLLSFKPRGLTKTETLQDDRYESLNISQDGVLGNAPLQPLPPIVKTRLPLFTSFLQHGRTLVSIIARTLAVHLSLAPDTFTALQPLDKPSGTQIRLLKAVSTHIGQNSRVNRP